MVEAVDRQLAELEADGLIPDDIRIHPVDDQAIYIRNALRNAVLAALSGDEWDETLLTRLSQVMMDASICGLGQAAPNPVLGLLKDFRETLADGGVRLIATSDAADATSHAADATGGEA